MWSVTRIGGTNLQARSSAFWMDNLPKSMRDGPGAGHSRENMIAAPYSKMQQLMAVSQDNEDPSLE